MDRCLTNMLNKNNIKLKLAYTDCHNFMIYYIYICKYYKISVSVSQPESAFHIACQRDLISIPSPCLTTIIINSKLLSMQDSLQYDMISSASSLTGTLFLSFHVANLYNYCLASHAKSSLISFCIKYSPPLLSFSIFFFFTILSSKFSIVCHSGSLMFSLPLFS